MFEFLFPRQIRYQVCCDTFFIFTDTWAKNAVSHEKVVANGKNANTALSEKYSCFMIRLSDRHETQLKNQ